MSAYHPIFGIGALLLVIGTAWIFSRTARVPAPHRYDSLDGLRGLLATLVMVNHAANWRGFAATGEWTLPPSRLYGHFGQTSVALFFMVTAFLFGSKLLDGRERPIDWLRLYVSRALRLIPLYLVFVACLVAVAAIVTGFSLRVSAPRLTLQTLQWLAFTMLDMPSINTFKAYVAGGAAWSLPYEWWFYFSLPLLGLLAGLRRSPLTIVASAAATVLAAYWTRRYGSPAIAASFLGGLAAALLVRQGWARAAARHPASAAVALLAVLVVLRTPVTFTSASTTLLTVAFVIIACGNTMAGILTSRPLRVLGEVSYSLYLLHGIVLYVAFSAVGISAVARLTAVQHWLVVYAAAPVLVCLCRLTFSTIEAPAMAAVDRTTAKIRRFLGPA